MRTTLISRAHEPCFQLTALDKVSFVDFLLCIGCCLPFYILSRFSAAAVEEIWGWRKGSVVESIDCSSRGPGYNFRPPGCHLTAVCNSGSIGSNSLTQTCRPKTKAHKKKKKNEDTLLWDLTQRSLRPCPAEYRLALVEQFPVLLLVREPGSTVALMDPQTTM